jgi:hypothetical protein
MSPNILKKNESKFIPINNLTPKLSKNQKNIKSH